MCDWCGSKFELGRIAGVDDLNMDLCPGCYYCFQHGAPIAEDNRAVC